MSENLKIDVVELDLAISGEESVNEAMRIFSPKKIRKRGKYAAEPLTFIGLISSITLDDLAREVIVTLIVSRLFQGAKKVREYLNTPALSKEPKNVLATHSMKAEGIIWEIRYDPSKELSTFLQGLIINLVDIKNLPDDSYRISINLINGYAKSFDEQGQFICNLPFDSSLLKK